MISTAGATPGEEHAMELFTAMRKRRMHRAFADEPVPRDLLEQMLWAAWRGATGRAGIRHFVVVDDRRLLKTLHQACPGFINNAPVAIAICSDLEVAERVGGRSGIEEICRIDAGTAAAHLTLAAPALGLGVCLVTSWTAGAVRAVLGLPAHLRPEILVACGIPAAIPSPAPKAFPRLAHHNTYGTPWEESA
jgi:nitroreductase